MRVDGNLVKKAHDFLANELQELHNTLEIFGAAVTEGARKAILDDVSETLARAKATMAEAVLINAFATQPLNMVKLKTTARTQLSAASAKGFEDLMRPAILKAAKGATNFRFKLE